VRGLRLNQCGVYRSQNIVRPLESVVIPKPQHSETKRSKLFGSGCVIPGPIEMLAAIQFDDQATLNTNEIHNVADNLMLAPKLETKLRAAQPRP